LEYLNVSPERDHSVKNFFLQPGNCTIQWGECFSLFISNVSPLTIFMGSETSHPQHNEQYSTSLI